MIQTLFAVIVAIYVVRAFLILFAIATTFPTKDKERAKKYRTFIVPIDIAGSVLCLLVGGALLVDKLFG